MLEWIDVFTTIALGLFMRFGIPLFLTGVLVWWLRRLDLRWQAEAEEARRIQLKEIMAHRTPCWEMRKCSPELRASCPAYQRNDLPCWQVWRETTGRLPERCIDCIVFKNAPLPQPQPA